MGGTSHVARVRSWLICSHDWPPVVVCHSTFDAKYSLRGLTGENSTDYWIRPHQPLPKTRGLHRFVWDLRHERPAVDVFGYPIAAVWRNTPRTPLGSWALPGRYTVRLTVNGEPQAAPLSVRMDPRVKTSPADLRRLYELSRSLDGALRRVATGQAAARARGTAGAPRAQELQRVSGTLAQLFGMVEGADVAPTSQLVAAVRDAVATAERLVAQP